MGNVYEFAEADPLTMKFYDFEQGAACMICCASAVLAQACIALVRLLGLRCKAPYVPAAKVWELCWQWVRSAAVTTNAARLARCAHNKRHVSCHSRWYEWS